MLRPHALPLLCLLGWLSAAGLGGPGSPGDGDAEALAPGFESITEEDVLAHLLRIAAPELEGRDSPSEGLTLAGDYLIARLQAIAAQPGGQNGGFRQRFTIAPRGQNPAPDPAHCSLVLRPEDGPEKAFVLEEDFVPLPHCAGKGEGPLTFFGFGITEADRKYDDLKGKNCRGEIVMVLEGEPRHKRLFEGPDTLTEAGDVYAKVKALEERGARGVLVVRRPPPEPSRGKGKGSAAAEPTAPAPIGYRHTWAFWNHEPRQPTRRINTDIPVLEISARAASEILGEDVLELAAGIDAKGKPVRRERKDLRLEISADFQAEGPVPVDNVVAILPGADPELAKEYVVLGAHYDHIGVDGWGRVGCGADDNGSGTTALIELAEAFALSRPARSMVFAWFAAEEDGLLGAYAFVDDPPVPLASIVAMVNMDMLGRCDEGEVMVVGTDPNPHFEGVLKEAKKLRETRIKKVLTNKGQEFWERSDQFAFHEKDIPCLFFSEGAIEADNPDYHTYNDTIERLSIPKITRATQLIFNTAWLIANDPERPPAPH